ncbi:probable calcium-binding protein CML10 [Juglans microcarpa x Juglans regia]|uniref:probable calcium-binding protein CML10 n=1 Tax=Juglans microcarpa x Juglans regia TaxID=2249226 RepID=UPI001B7E28C6|nr:probable calcium-binding protein CML10 [Juglans microcarpa x Juglans regia]
MDCHYGVVNQCQHLTADQSRGILKKYDANNDGGLNKKELNDAFQSLGAHLRDKPGRLPGRGGRPPGRGGRPPGRGGRRALHHADADGDGLIWEEEPPRALHHADVEGDGLIGEEKPRRAHHHADVDGDGLIMEEVVVDLLH